VSIAFDALEHARQAAGLSTADLWVRYFGLGGMASDHELIAYMSGASQPSRIDHDLIAQALNEEFSAQGRDWPMAYTRP